MHPEHADGWGAATTAACLALLVAVVAWFEAPFVLDRAIVVERDALSSILPIRAFLAHALRAGEWPMWNPAPVLGKPFLPEWQTGLFYPPSLLLLVEPFSRGFNLFFAFHYGWTAVGAFLLARALGTTRTAALLGAIVWSLGGPLVSLGHLLNHLMAIAWLPWVLWGWARTDDVRSRVVVSSLLLALCLLTGSPEMALLVAGLLVLVAWDVRALWVPPLAALLAAMQLVPVWNYLGATHRGAHGLSAEGIMAFSTPVARLAGFVVPGTESVGAFLPTLYVGLVPLLLAVAALGLVSALTRLIVLLVTITLVGLALGSNGGLLPLLHQHVPGVDVLRYPEKLLLGVHALVAAGAAWGLSALTLRLPRFGAWIAIVVVIVAGVDLARVNRGALFSLPPAQVFSPTPMVTAMRQGASDPADTRYYANSTGVPRTQTIAEAIGVDRELLWAATGELFGLANVNTPASLNLVSHERLHRSLERVLQPQALAVLGALGTRWVTSFSELRGPDIDRVALEGGEARLYALGHPAQRAFVARRVTIARDAEQALSAFVQANDPRGTAVLEGVGVATLAYEPPRHHDVTWVESTSDELAIDVSLDGPGLFVVNDTYLDGWRASVDGQPANIERVNGLVRGVWLDAGQHRVRMRYRPPGLPLGLALSLTTFVALLLGSYRG